MELKTMESEIPNEDEQETSIADTDWDNRILCSDENCIGVIGPDGHCKECGKKYEGSLPEAGAADKENLSAGEDGPDETADVDAQAPPSADVPSEEKSESGDWADRKLCSDGSCIGVIGPDGRCKECGKSYE
jgi:hypothetical protein